MIPDRLILPVAASIVLHAAAFFSIRRSDAPRPEPAAVGVASASTAWILMPPPEDPPLVDLAAAEKPSGGPSLPTLPETPALASAPSAIAMAVSAESLQPNPPLVTATAAPTVAGVGIGPSGGGMTISSRLLDNPPRTRSQRPPVFPNSARHAGITGHVLAEFTVDETGRVSAVRIVSSNDARFDAPTISAISAWRFEPGRRDGRVVRFRMQIPVDYTLDEG